MRAAGGHVVEHLRRSDPASSGGITSSSCRRNPPPARAPIRPPVHGAPGVVARDTRRRARRRSRPPPSASASTVTSPVAAGAGAQVAGRALPWPGRAPLAARAPRRRAWSGAPSPGARAGTARQRAGRAGDVPTGVPSVTALTLPFTPRSPTPVSGFSGLARTEADTARTGEAAQMARRVAIVGAALSRLRPGGRQVGVRAAPPGHVSRALADAGIARNEVDGFMSHGTGALPPIELAEYLGMAHHIDYIDSTGVGGSCWEMFLEHAVAAIAQGQIDTVVLSATARPAGPT